MASNAATRAATAAAAAAATAAKSKTPLTPTATDVGSALSPLLQDVDLGLGLGAFPVYYYLLAILVVLLYTYRSRQADRARVAAAARAAAEEANRSRRVLERPIDPNRTFTKQQLKAYDGSNPTSPIYMSVCGKVYDVTAGESFYGPGGGYACFAGIEASRGLAKMEFTTTGEGWSDLTVGERQVLHDWIARFDMKYSVVGKLIIDA